jgi:hypothetical protein
VSDQPAANLAPWQLASNDRNAASSNHTLDQWTGIARDALAKYDGDTVGVMASLAIGLDTTADVDRLDLCSVLAAALIRLARR